MVFILEGFYFYLTSGHFLLHYEICSVAPRDYALKTLAGNFYISEWLNVLYYYRPPLYYFPYLFNIHSVASDTSFPEIWHFSYLLIFSIIVLFLIKKHKKIFFPLLWFSGLLLFMEFGFIGIEFFRDSFTINYILICKEIRYFSVLSTPICLILSYFFITLYKKGLKILMMIFIFLLFIFSVTTLRSTSFIMTDPVSDMRDASKYLANIQNENIYCDSDCISLLDYYFGFKKYKFIKKYRRY